MIGTVAASRDRSTCARRTALDQLLDDAERAKILDGTAELHFDLETDVRNNFGLWSRSLLWRW
jgi:hypothetical protein